MLVICMTESADVLCAGIIVADHVCTPISHVPAAGELVAADGMLLTLGGCAANTAVDLSKMGARAAVAGCVGDDPFGQVTRAMLQESGVEISGVRINTGRPTSQTLIVNVRGEDRRFIHTFGANADFRAADIPIEQVARCKALYVGGYLAMPNLIQDELAAILASAKRTGAITMLDVVTPGAGDYMPRLRAVLPYVDVFLPNHHEAELICGEKEPLRQALYFRDRGVGTCIITMGAEGSLLVSEHARLRAGVYDVPYVDGSGGGDAFAAGYLYGLLAKLEAEECLRAASALGASCVRAIGTTPGVFTRSECEEFVRRHELIIQKV
jgi:sugar/nucleoside kinase (ribokinase family)